MKIETPEQHLAAVEELFRLMTTAGLTDADERREEELVQAILDYEKGREES